MRNHIRFLFLFTTTCIVYSCKKEGIRPNEGTVLLQFKGNFVDGNYSNRRFDRDGSGKLLKFRDSSDMGWVETVIFEYTPNGRISKANYKNEHGDVLFHLEFEYDANGRVRKKQDRPGTINLADDYHLYGYDFAGRLVADSVFAFRSMPAAHELASVNKFIYTGDNVTESEYYSYYSGSAVLEGRRKFDYDEGINPYKNVDNYYSITSAAFAIDRAKYLSQNNVVKEYAADGSGAYQLRFSYNYQYNSSNYPWKFKVSADSLYQGLVEAEYFYKQ